MKKLLLLLTVFGSLQLAAQMNCNPIDFEDTTQGQSIFDQFQPCGLVFSSPSTGLPPQIHDYGDLSFGKVMHSPTWYAEIRIDFVTPDAGNPVLASYFSMNNPIDSEVDQITVTAYDFDGNEVASTTSSSPEIVVLETTGPQMAYIIIDDLNDTAYVIDDIYVSGFGVSVEEASAESAPRFYPNPFESMLTIDRLQSGDRIELFDVTGRLVYTETSATSRIDFNGSALAAGRYLLKVYRNGVPILVEAVKR